MHRVAVQGQMAGFNKNDALIGQMCTVNKVSIGNEEETISLINLALTKDGSIY